MIGPQNRILITNDDCLGYADARYRIMAIELNKPRRCGMVPFSVIERPAVKLIVRLGKRFQQAGLIRPNFFCHSVARKRRALRCILRISVTTSKPSSTFS